jgi:hypothetical protein
MKFIQQKVRILPAAVIRLYGLLLPIQVKIMSFPYMPKQKTFSNFLVFELDTVIIFLKSYNLSY